MRVCVSVGMRRTGTRIPAIPGAQSTLAHGMVYVINHTRTHMQPCKHTHANTHTRVRARHTHRNATLKRKVGAGGFKNKYYKESHSLSDMCALLPPAPMGTMMMEDVAELGINKHRVMLVGVPSLTHALSLYAHARAPTCARARACVCV